MTPPSTTSMPAMVTTIGNLTDNTDVQLDYSLNFQGLGLAWLCQISFQNLSHCLVFSIFTCVGVIGNLTLLLAILLNKQLLSVPNIFIVNLTVADLVYMLATAPFNIRHELTPCWLLGLAACKIKHYIPLVAQAACVFSLASLSRERYTAIVKGLESILQKSSRRTLLIIGLCWLAGFIIGIPVLTITRTLTNGLLCQYMPIEDGFTWPKGYIIFIFLILYVIPFSIISIHYAVIARTLCKSSITQLTDNNQALVRQVQARKRLALIVIIITAFFGLFWFPYHVYHMWYMFTKNHGNIRGNKSHVQFFRHFYNYMSLANSCLNPWVVFAMSSAHRRPLVACLRKVACRNWSSKLNRRQQAQNLSIANSSGYYPSAASTSVSKL